MKPERKICLLRTWISKMVDRHPKPYINFETWLRQKYPMEMKGTYQWFKRFATHCFYCNTKFGGEVKKTIDHWVPKNGDASVAKNRYVICCETCNGAKGNSSPEVIIKNCRAAIYKDQKAFGLRGKRLKIFEKRMTEIYNDNLYDVSERVYYKINKSIELLITDK